MSLNIDCDQTTTCTTNWPRPEPKMTEAECLEAGGHCYRQDDYVIDTYPPIYHRHCKHCGKGQHGHSQPNMRWEDA